MASRLRRMETVNADRENQSLRPGKVAVSKPLVSRRPALGELCHNINASSQNNGKKGDTLKMGPPAAAKKTTIKVQKPKTTTLKTGVLNTETIQKKECVTVTHATTSLNRQDSILKQIVHVETSTKTKEEVSYSTRQIIDVTDVDVNDKNDPFLVTEYVQDIFQYLRSSESNYKITQDYMVGHRSTPRMRSVLVNWMIDVHINFKFLFETLHLSIAILDRYLQIKKTIGRDTLQLVGATAMIIAGKYEEMYMPEIEDFVYVCDNTFTRSQFLKMELEMLNKLKFNIGCPLSLHFLRRFNKIARAQHDHHNLAKYLLEIFLLQYELCHFDHSMQAAAACCLSISVLNEVSDPAKVWTKTLVYHSSYKYSDIKPAVLLLAYHLANIEKSKYQAVRQKYANANYGKISLNAKLQGPLVRKLADEARSLKK